ncbi:iron-containing redox enzyme family protein [Pseudomonas aeruginosa]|nr:iron-containing redox enzyme family protein [Pseudomonas aeruginosa]EKV3074762.1 iron-containing redox enzyme family protein [Pseudomonas aeruginosa]
MSLSSPLPASSASPSPRVRDLYHALLDEPREHLEAAGEFLDQQLSLAATHDDDLPEDPADWPAWLDAGARRTAEAHAEYLRARRRGEGRRYFQVPSQAMHFIRSVAPTKLVDGAWLYGLLPHHGEERLRPLLETFLEELGDGVPARNHVLLYRRLLASIGSEEVEGLSDLHYLQGTQQLALGHLAADYLPEVIGYNLGYEQPPLHLLITTHELRELGFDPYYFQLHVTIDNAASGHARKALRALYDNLPQLGGRAAFLERVRNGYRLNEVGLSTEQVIDGFDLEEELLAMFERKRPYAAGMHSDRCRIGGRTVNQWLAVPGRFPAFLACLEEEGWIRRHADPRGSRFWNLIEGDRAAMFGVFTPYEQQLLYDWIAVDWQAPAPAGSDVDAEQVALRRELLRLSPEQGVARLLELMAPHRHHGPAGLLATRMFSQRWRAAHAQPE